MSRTDDDMNPMPMNDFSDENIEALARKYLAEVELIGAEVTEPEKDEGFLDVREKRAFEKSMMSQYDELDEILADELSGELYPGVLPEEKNPEERNAEHTENRTENRAEERTEERVEKRAEEHVEERTEKRVEKRTEERVAKHTEENAPGDSMIDAGTLPFTLSVADSDGLAVTVLEKGTRLPARVRMNFSAPYKTPSAVKFRLYMGEGLFAKDNILVDYIKLPGIREYKGGITKIVMHMTVERNGDISIELLDEGSVTKRTDKIELDFAECRTALADRQTGPNEGDAELRDNYLVIQKARFICTAAERYLKMHKKEIDKEMQRKIKEKVKELKRACRKTDIANMSAAQKASIKNLMREVF